MDNAISLFNYIFNKFLSMIFVNFQISNNVTLGWVIISIIVMGILINSILNIPNNIRFNKKYNGRPTKSVKGTNTNG